MCCALDEQDTTGAGLGNRAVLLPFIRNDANDQATTMKNIAALLLVCLATSASTAGSALVNHTVAEPQAKHTTAALECRSVDACGKIGLEDKQMILVEQGRARRKNLIKNGTDRERWAVPIYSDSTRPAELQLMLLRSNGLTMRLAPQLGILYFESPKKIHAFKIAAAPGDAGAMCPSVGAD
jgi:hypothetical protein